MQNPWVTLGMGVSAALLSTLYCILSINRPLSRLGIFIYVVCLVTALAVAWDGFRMASATGYRGLSAEHLALVLPMLGRILVKRYGLKA
ncbi:MAG: hypothetical protein JST12_13355 [Armatimonadetes bacterium]|nr:hypothetical protein [Armatimonadota bacterium]